jgi:hypothetical protein
MSFLEAVRDANPAGDICVILDNARIHHAALNLFCTKKDSYSKKWLEKFDVVLLDQRLGG